MRIEISNSGRDDESADKFNNRIKYGDLHMSIQDKRLREELRAMIGLCRSCRKRSSYSSTVTSSLDSLLRRIERELSTEVSKIETKIREDRRETMKGDNNENKSEPKKPS